MNIKLIVDFIGSALPYVFPDKGFQPKRFVAVVVVKVVSIVLDPMVQMVALAVLSGLKELLVMLVVVTGLIMETVEPQARQLKVTLISLGSMSVLFTALGLNLD